MTHDCLFFLLNDSYFAKLSQRGNTLTCPVYSDRSYMYQIHGVKYTNTNPPIRRLLHEKLGVTSHQPTEFGKRLTHIFNSNTKKNIGLIIRQDLFEELKDHILTQGGQTETLTKEDLEEMPVIVFAGGTLPSDLLPSHGYYVQALYNKTANKLEVTNLADIPLQQQPLQSQQSPPQETDVEILPETKFSPEKEENAKPVFSAATTTKSQMKLRLNMPSFDPTTDSIEDAILKLKRLQTLVPDQSSSLIYNFISANGLDQLLINLDSTELNSIAELKKALIRRYPKSNKATEFHALVQSPNESEVDYFKRVERHWKRLTNKEDLAEGDKSVITEKFIQGLADAQTRLRLREEQPAYENLADRAARIRHARILEDTSSVSLERKINKLTEDLAKISTGCTHCGLGHLTQECRANPKARAQFNKRVKFERSRSPHHRRQKNFRIPNGPPPVYRETSHQTRGRGNQYQNKGWNLHRQPRSDTYRRDQYNSSRQDQYYPPRRGYYTKSNFTGQQRNNRQERRNNNERNGRRTQHQSQRSTQQADSNARTYHVVEDGFDFYETL